MLDCIQFFFFLHHLILIQSHFEVLLKLNCIGTAHGRLNRSKWIALDVESKQFWQQGQSCVQVVYVVVRNGQSFQGVEGVHFIGHLGQFVVV